MSTAWYAWIAALAVRALRMIMIMLAAVLAYRMTCSLYGVMA